MKRNPIIALLFGIAFLSASCSDTIINNYYDKLAVTVSRSSTIAGSESLIFSNQTGSSIIAIHIEGSSSATAYNVALDSGANRIVTAIASGDASPTLRLSDIGVSGTFIWYRVELADGNAYTGAIDFVSTMYLNLIVTKR